MEEFLIPSEMIVVKQLPIIEDMLADLRVRLQEDLERVKSLAATEENYKELKRIRAEWNKRIDALETARKKIKAEIEAPYKQFEKGPYSELLSDIRSAVEQLDGGIKDVERVKRTAMQEELLAYYEEYRQQLGLDAALADPKKSGIKVGLSDSMKSLKEQARAFLDRVDGDLKMIDTLDNADEVLAEYRECMSVTDAVRIVADRHKRVEAERERRRQEEEARRQKEEQIAAVNAAAEESVSAPVVSASPEVAEQQEENQPVVSTRYLGFEVFGTLDQLRGLKGYLQEALQEYCEMEGMK